MATYGSVGGHMNEYRFNVRAILIEESGEIRDSRGYISQLSEGEFPEKDIAEQIDDTVSEIF